MDTDKHKHPVKSVGNDVTSMLDHKLTNKLTYSVITDALISLSCIQAGVSQDWSHLLVATVSSESIKNGPPSMIGTIL